MRRVEEVYAGGGSKQAASISAGSRSALPSRATDDQRETRLSLLSGATSRGKSISAAATASPRSFSAGSSDSSPPLPAYNQSVSSALTGAGSSSLSASNTDNGVAGGTATHAAASGKGQEEGKRQGGQAAKEDQGRLSKGKGERKGDGERCSKVGHSNFIKSSTRGQDPFTAKTTKESGFIEKTEKPAASLAAGNQVDTGKEISGDDAREREEKIRRGRDIRKTRKEDGGGRWTTLFKGSVEGILERGERKGERSSLIPNGACSSTQVGSVRRARGAPGIYEEEADVGSAESRDRAGSSNGGLENPTAVATGLSSEAEQERGIRDLRAKQLKAKHWMLLSLATYVVLGLLVLYCISYANVEWCCIFIIFGGIAAGLGLSGLKHANRTMLLLHAVGAAILLVSLFIAWCYNVFVLLRAVEILMASSWTPVQSQPFLSYYSIPTTYTSPPAPWIEDVLHMRLSYPFEDKAGIESLIGTKPHSKDSGGYALRSRKLNFPNSRRQQRRKSERVAVSTTATTEEESNTESESVDGRTAGEEHIGKVVKSSARTRVVPEPEKEQAAQTATPRERLSETGRQMPRKLGGMAANTSAGVNERKGDGSVSREENFHLKVSTDADKAARNAVRRRLAAELHDSQRRQDGSQETQEEESERRRQTAVDRETLHLTNRKKRRQRGSSNAVHLLTKDPRERQQRAPVNTIKGKRMPMEKQITRERDDEQGEATAGNLVSFVVERQKGTPRRGRTTRDWQTIWREERSAGGLRRRLGEATLVAGAAAPGTPTARKTTAAAQTSAASVPAPPETPAAAGAVRIAREPSREIEETKRRRSHLRFPAAENQVPSSKGSSANLEARGPASSPSRNSSKNSADADKSDPPLRSEAADLPLTPAVAEKSTAQGDRGEDGPLEVQLRESGESLPLGPAVKMSPSSGSADASAFYTPLPPHSAVDSHPRKPSLAGPSLSHTLARAQRRSYGHGSLNEEERSSYMDRDRTARRLIQGCLNGARKDSAFAGKAAHTMSTFATRGWLCAFARADVLPFHRWPVDCNTECGYAFLHVDRDLQSENFYDMSRVAEYLIQISSLPPKRMQQCMDYAAATVCSIQNRSFIVVWVVLLLLWLLFACAACCGILPFSLYSTAQVIKKMHPHA